MDLPFSSEYAKTGRAKCKLCKEQIDKDTLRLAAMVQSAFHDGKQANWFHGNCFFKKQKPNSTGDILNFENLKYDDQKYIETQMKQMGGDVLPVAKGKKRTKKDQTANQAALKDYGIEYSVSGRAGCCGCAQKIAKDTIRIKKVVYDTEVGMKYGGQPLWHHVDCFVAVRDELGYWASGADLNGFKSLSKEDQATVKKAIPASKVSDVPALKKMKPEPKDEVDKANDDADEKLYQKQNKTFHKYKDQLKSSGLRAVDLVSILTKNKQHVPEGNSEKIDMVADIMSFGALDKCAKCPNGRFIFGKQGYICTGDLTEWVKCENLVREPKRLAVKIPAALKKSCEFLNSFKSVLEHRAIKFAPITNLGNRYVKKEEGEGPRVEREKPPLYNLEFAIIGDTKGDKEEIKKLILKLGGKVTTKLHEKLAAVISTEAEVEKLNKRMETVKDLGIQVVPEDYLTSVKSGGAIDDISTKAICDWGTDPHLRCSHEELKSSSRSLYSKSGPSKVTVKVKGGVAVDPDSHLEDVAHIFERNKIKYNSTLTLTDIQRGKNSYYKMQILESDKGHKYWFFRGWGRIGTTIGGSKTEEFGDVESAIEQLMFHYHDKTGNVWNKQFKKIPGKMVPADIDYGEDEPDTKMSETSSIKSKLDKPVQDIIKLIFNVENMKKAMMEFELDTEKMPLGKLSKKQLQAALSVLGELSVLITQGGSNSQFIDATNRFFTFVPHSFGTKMPPILDSIEVIKTKVEMLESLMEIEVAYSMLNSGESDKVNPIDTHYDQLKTSMETIKHESEEFKILQKYVENTHAATHNSYDLEIVDAFKISRTGEERRYKPFKKLNNRKLLWHGSRVTNYAGILSHGLKIAPPEAPVTGYMFGKGIYFADMVSKSANYCCTSKSSNTGLVLLCEVALGEMEEYTNAHYVQQLQKNKHSCKGVGKTMPDPSESIVKDGVEIPMGKSLTDNKLKSSLLYNEYIVYDVAQVKCQYLLRLNFKYKY